MSRPVPPPSCPDCARLMVKGANEWICPAWVRCGPAGGTPLEVAAAAIREWQDGWAGEDNPADAAAWVAVQALHSAGYMQPASDVDGDGRMDAWQSSGPPPPSAPGAAGRSRLRTASSAVTDVPPTRAESPAADAVCPVTGRPPVGYGCTGDDTCQVHHATLNGALAANYTPGALYSVLTCDGWRVAAFSGARFHGAGVDQGPRAWEPIEGRPGRPAGAAACPRRVTMSDTGWRLEPATDCEGRTADDPAWATCCHHKGFRRYSLTVCTGDDSCRVPDHWRDPKYSGPHRERGEAS